MKIVPSSLITLLCIGLLGMLSCSPSAGVIPSSNVPLDQPRLTASEAIGIAKQDALDHPAWANNTKLASFYVNSQGWNAKYIGNGKWTVDLRISSQDGASVTINRWSIFESNLAAVYVGEYIESKPNISSQVSKEQAIQLVKEYGVPGCSSKGIAKPVGEWTAVLDNEGIWFVTGNVEITEGATIYQVITRWEYNGYTVILETFIK